MNKAIGHPLPLGVTEEGEYVNFSVAVESGKNCTLCIYKKESEVPAFLVELIEDNAVGEVRFVALPKCEVSNREYNYQIDGEFVLDPYVKQIVGADAMRGKILTDAYDWEGDVGLAIPYHEVVAYTLHVRGFTKHDSSGVKHGGTFLGMVEKIPYLKELGVNQVQCMPVYAFVDTEQYKNYWGYGDAYCFAPKNAYAATEDAVKELKDMVKAYHKSGIEVVLHLPFTEKMPKQLILDCLRYYVMEYHVDGFLLNPYVAPMDAVLSDPVLKKTKILQNRDEFQNAMRRFLRGEEHQISSVMWWLKQTTKESGSCNYITNHTGFTLADLVSYDEKHNEQNGENNQDGPNDNYSWNCGAEGTTKKKAVLKLRKRQVKNALFLLMAAQGTPCILAGDEFGNSQDGNNNVYCQDNEVAWLNWENLQKDKELVEYVKTLIALRKRISVLGADKPLLGADRTSCGVPDISFHGKEAWQIPTQSDSLGLGVYYHGQDGTDCFVAYNMSEEAQTFGLPTLGKKKKWYRICSTADERFEEYEKLEENQKEVHISDRTIAMFIGK